MSKLRLGRVLGCLSTTIVLAAATPAGATLYTIDGNTSVAGLQPIAFSQGGVSGSILPASGSLSTLVAVAGTVSDFNSQDWLIVQVVLNAGSASVDQFGISAIGVNTVLGVGYYDDATEDPTGGSVSGSAGLLDFGHLTSGPLNLQAGETSDQLFATFALGALPGPGLPPIFAPGTASFMISGGANFSVQGAIVPVPNPIPEPAGVVLLAAGLAGLGWWRPRRRGRA